MDSQVILRIFDDARESLKHFLQALNGFVMMITQTGKLLYISENASEYLGHSMEDLLIHGDSIYDIIDKQDHPTVQAELLRGQELTSPEELSSSKPEDRIFLCRMNVSRNARRQMRFGDQKVRKTQFVRKPNVVQVILVEGHFYGILPNVSRSEPVFVAWCTPVAMPETRECVVQVEHFFFFIQLLFPLLLLLLICTLSLLSHVVVAGRD